MRLKANSDIKPNSDSYQKSYSRHGQSPKALQWGSYHSAALRYRELVSDIDIDGRTILDAGCGMGDLLPYLYAKSDNFDYTGIDITPEFIDVAKKRYEGHKFRTDNPFNKNFTEKYDIIVSSGVMNFNAENWLEIRQKMIAHLFELANEALVFNMAGAITPIAPEGKVAYADAQEILKFCASLTPRVILKTNYRPKDFTIVMFK